MSYKSDYLSKNPEELRRSFFENSISEIIYMWEIFEPRISSLIEDIKAHRLIPKSINDFDSVSSEIENLVTNDLKAYVHNIHTKSISMIRDNEKTIFNQVMLLKEPEIFGNLIYGIIGDAKYNQQNPNLTMMYENFIRFEINHRYPEYVTWENSGKTQLTSIRVKKFTDFSSQTRERDLNILEKFIKKNNNSEYLKTQISLAVNANKIKVANKFNKELANNERKDVWRFEFKDELGIVYSQNCAHSIQGFANNVRHGIDARQRTIRDEQNRAIKDPITGANSIGGIHIVRNNFSEFLYSVEEILRIHKTTQSIYQ